jgi:tetratricopeptide (TPR) repeat protein
MRRSLFAAIVLAYVLFSGTPSLPQAGSANQDTPETLRTAYDHAIAVKDWPSASAAAQKLVNLRASAENLRLLGDVQIYSNEPTDALASYDRALTTAQQEKPPQGQSDSSWKELVGKIVVGKGNAYPKLHRNSDANAEYIQAAEMAPNPGVAYFNLCATNYNIGDMQSAVPFCRKAIRADPARGDAWFLLGSLLYADAKIDAQGNFAISDECRQALNKYLELVPNGPHAADVKAMLDAAAK